MKRSLARCALIMFVIALLAACNSPQPLPVAPTKIPSLPPATLPPAVTATPRAGVAGVTFPKAPVSAIAGEAIYKARCVSCHGADGKAQVASARAISPMWTI